MPQEEIKIPEIGERVPKCDGSFKVGTACGVCARCRSRGYSLEKKEQAVEAEKERTKDLPPDRVKSRDPQAIKVEVTMPTVEEEKV